MDKRDFIGFTYAAPLYGFGEEPGLLEAAKRVLALGCRTLKLFLPPSYRSFYGFDPDWPACATVAEIAQAAPMRRALDLDFHTLVLEYAPLASGFPEGFSAAQLAEEYRQTYDLAAWLFTAYAGTGKTFILQNWESDWAVRGASRDPETDPAPEAIDHLVEWANNRQAAVDAARRDHPGAGVNVWHCLEANLVLRGMEGHISVATHAFPRTHCDLYSYSAYDTSIDRERFGEALDFLLAHCPASETVGERNLRVGEFGIPENEFSPEAIDACIENTLQQAYDRGLRHAIYWQLYDNERSETDPSGCRGFWLIRKDGSPAHCYPLFTKWLKEDATCAAW